MRVLTKFQLFSEPSGKENYYNFDKTQVILFFNLMAIPFDYLLISLATK